MIDAIFYGIIGGEVALITAFFTLVVVGYLLSKFNAWWNPVYPYCDIDPRCHPAFVVAEDGDGWIGGIKVVCK